MFLYTELAQGAGSFATQNNTNLTASKHEKNLPSYFKQIFLLFKVSHAHL